MQVTMNGPQWLVVTQELPGIEVQSVMDALLRPEVISRWWGAEATVEPKVGGRWQMDFAAADMTLVGEIGMLSDRQLMVTWVWKQEPELPARMALFEVDSAGAMLTITQGPYRQGEAFPREDEDRTSHIEGWEYYLPKLVEVLSAAD